MNAPVPYMGSEPYIFVSYSHRDSDRVLPILARMQADGYRVWYDDGIDPGSEWDENIASHVNGCRCFLAFLTRNYVESGNCLDELNYARDQSRNLLLVYLEDVRLSDGMGMRFNRLQAVLWYRYRSDEAGFRKLYAAEGIDACREVPEPEPEAPAPEPRLVRTDETQSDQTPPKPQKPQKPKKPRKPMKKRLLIAAAAVVLVLAIGAAVGILRGMGGQREDLSPLLYGTYVVKDADLSSYAEKAVFVTRTTENGDYEMSELPAGVLSNPEWPGLLVLGFCDRFGEPYYFYGRYTLTRDTLTVTPYKGSLPDGFAEQSFGAGPLGEKLSFRFSLENGYYGLRIGNDVVYLHNAYYAEHDGELLQGRASADEAYEDLLWLDCELQGDNVRTCVVGLADGGQTTDAAPDSQWEGYFSARWSTEQRPYNGREETFDVYGYLSFYYYNTWPYGFAVKAKDQFYFYQNPLE